MFRLLTKHWQWLCILGCLLCCTQNAQATHSMGLDLTYSCIGNNQYRVVLSFYRDCNGISVTNTATVRWKGSCGTGSISLGNRTVEEITPSCPGIVGTACNGGNGVFGIEKYTFVDTLTVPGTCTDLTLSYQMCCRNGAITTLANPMGESMYVEATITNSRLCNNSPIFTNDPVPFGCVGQPIFYNHGAVDADGDDLVYSFVDCYSRDTIPVVYAAGFSATTPLAATGLSINPNTGAITFTPTIAQVGVLCVAVQEFRNGVLIGQIVRDIQFTAVPCSNTIPTLSGINNTNDFTTSVQANNQLCFDLFSNDVDLGQTTTLTWNNAIPGATFTTNGIPFANGRFCWTPTAAGTYTFTVNVRDDFCPVVGQNTFTYTINVTAPPPPPPCDSLTVALISSTDLVCDSSDGTAIIVANGGVAPYNYQIVNWTTGTFYNNTTGIFAGLPAGNYTIWVVDVNGCTPSCSGQTFTINGNVVPLAIAATAQNVDCPSNSINTRDTSNLGGAINVNATGGTAPYMYSIDGGNSFQTSANFDFLAAGTYTVVVMDANGCTQTTSATIVEPDPIRIAVASLSPALCGQSNGSITLLASGGTNSFLYYINGQAQGSPTFNNLAPGTYTFRVCDMNYCVYDTTITIPNTPGIVGVGTSTNPSCIGDCDGTATVTATATATGSTAFSVLWNNGATTTTINNLCAGVYTATLTDVNGCSDVVTVTVTDPAPVDVTLVFTSDETCAGNDGSAVVAASGGTAPYSYNLANFTTSSVSNNTTGNFSNLNAGQFVVNVTDANGCAPDCSTSFLLEGCSGGGGNDDDDDGGGVLERTPVLLDVNPNPASSIVQVRYQTSAKSVQLSIISSNGKMIYNQGSNEATGSMEISVNNWANGTYFVLLKDQEGKIVKSTKLVISK